LAEPALCAYGKPEERVGKASALAEAAKPSGNKGEREPINTSYGSFFSCLDDEID